MVLVGEHVLKCNPMRSLRASASISQSTPARRSAARKIMDISKKKVLPRIRFRLDDAGAGPERRELEDVFGRQRKPELGIGQYPGKTFDRPALLPRHLH